MDHLGARANSDRRIKMTLLGTPRGQGVTIDRSWLDTKGAAWAREVVISVVAVSICVLPVHHDIMVILRAS